MKWDTLAESQAEALSLLRQISSNFVTGAGDQFDDVLLMQTRTLEDLEELDKALESSEYRKKLVRIIIP